MLERGWRKRTFFHYWWECKLIQQLWNTVWWSLKKLGIKLPYDSTHYMYTITTTTITTITTTTIITNTTTSIIALQREEASSTHQNTDTSLPNQEPCTFTDLVSVSFPTRRSSDLKSTNNKCWRGGGEKEPSFTIGGNVNWYSNYGIQYGDPLKN